MAGNEPPWTNLDMYFMGIVPNEGDLRIRPSDNKLREVVLGMGLTLLKLQDAMMGCGTGLAVPPVWAGSQPGSISHHVALLDVHSGPGCSHPGLGTCRVMCHALPGCLVPGFVHSELWSAHMSRGI